MKSNSRADVGLVHRLSELPLTEAERAIALAHVRRGEAIADAIIAVVRALGRQTGALDRSQARRAAG